MRIGIHTGAVIGGVIGTDIIRFDIYGEDALIANKIESNGEKKRVNVSQTTKEMLEGFPGYEFIPHKELELRDKNLQMYFVESK